MLARSDPLGGCNWQLPFGYVATVHLLILQAGRSLHEFFPHNGHTQRLLVDNTDIYSRQARVAQ